MMEGHPCKAVLTRGKGGDSWTGPEAHRMCGKKDPEKPMVFRGTDWCCDNHRKLVGWQRGPYEVPRPVVGGVT